MNYPEIDPIAIALGPVKIHWYAVSYLAGIGIAWWLLKYRNRKYQTGWKDSEIDDLVFWSVLGVILGGRLGYMLFYGWEQVLANPLVILKVWQGGMSFHGGLIGVALAFYFYGRSVGKHFFKVSDFVSPVVPIGLGAGRLGNFANAELPGRVTDVPWGFIYPGDDLIRHPSSLYQFGFEGPILLCLLWIVASRSRPMMVVTGVFGAGYGVLRFISEFFREPDVHLGFVALNSVTMGQILSLPMIALGLIMIWWGYQRQKR